MPRRAFDDIPSGLLDGMILARLEDAGRALEAASRDARTLARPDIQQPLDKVRESLARIRSAVGRETGLYV